MKKSVVIVLAVAIIGILGIYSKYQGSSAQTKSSSTSSQVATTPGNNSSSSNSGNSSSTSSTNGAYKDGTYTGTGEDTPYGTVQIAVVISGGKITDVNFLQMPSDMGHSREVTGVAGPILKAETLQAQSSHIDFVSGASSTSQGYMLSLQSALDQAA